MSGNPFKRSQAVQEPKDAEPWAIFDLDDTITHTQWRAHHLDKEKNEGRANWDAFFDACGEDPPLEQMLVHALTMQAAGVRLAFWTGRPEKQREKTLDWLARHGAREGFELLMRPNSVFRKDHEIKRGWMEEAVARRGKPLCAFDDREHNRAVFEAFGVPCADPLRPDLVEAVVKTALEQLKAARASSRPARGI